MKQKWFYKNEGTAREVAEEIRGMIHVYEAEIVIKRWVVETLVTPEEAKHNYRMVGRSPDEKEE